MKSIISIMFSACAAVVVMSCNDNSTSDTTKTDSSSTMSSTSTDTSNKMTTATTDNNSVAMVEAPAAARTSFETKYKNAKNVTWRKYTPVNAANSAMDEWDYSYDLDTSYYQVNYNWNDLDYMAWYNPKGEWIKSYAKVENTSGLPDAINNVINSKFKGYKVTDIEIEDRKKGMNYEVDLDNGTSKKKVKFSPSGAILKQKDKS